MQQTKISIVIPSAPDRSPEAILQNLEKIKPSHVSFEIFIIKGTWPPLQRNMGIKAATGEYIFLFDDDIIIPDGIIEKVLKIFEENPSMQVVGGPNLTPPENAYIQHCFGLAHASPFVGLQTSARYRISKKIRNATEKHLISCNLAFRAKILKENLFDGKIFPNEENELLARIRQKGHGLLYDPEFFVYHHRRKKLTEFVKQIFNWGRGRTIHSLQKPQNFDPLFFVPLIFLLYLISLWWIHTEWYFLPLAAYIILGIIFAIEAAVTFNKVSALPSMLLLFPLTHIVYALGLIIGFVGFLKEKNIPEEKEFLLIKIDLD